MAQKSGNTPDLSGLTGVGHNVLLTKPDGTPTLVNLFKMVTATPAGENTEIIIEMPKSIAGAGAGTGGGSYGQRDIKFKVADGTQTILVKESPQEILQKHADALKFLR